MGEDTIKTDTMSSSPACYSFFSAIANSVVRSIDGTKCCACESIIYKKCIYFCLFVHIVCCFIVLL